ncbi:MAG: nucleotide exchange factor GrpE [Burkholderiaceae bacterium]|jgi:molecular chaperone GrpE|nr:nucleotide exchange factor GrpE [Burkholderiaceae bacterium]MEB2320166.1 nucleotide exchange factor GrpE [Pseudomonadota bacterium]
MMQGPENDRPEPYVSPHAPESVGTNPRPATGPTPGPAAGPAHGGATPRPEQGPGFGSAGASPASAGRAERAPADAAPAAAADQGELEALRAELAAAEAKAAANHEQLLRTLAETENLRRRTQEEILKARKFANESFAESLLPVIDSLELALKVEAPSVESLREGVEATLRLMVSAFEKNQLVGIDPAGQKFDPNHHQAISMVPADATNPPTPANHVATVLQKGYLINDRVLRPALVTVAQG